MPLGVSLLSIRVTRSDKMHLKLGLFVIVNTNVHTHVRSVRQTRNGMPNMEAPYNRVYDVACRLPVLTALAYKELWRQGGATPHAGTKTTP